MGWLIRYTFNHRLLWNLLCSYLNSGGIDMRKIISFLMIIIICIITLTGCQTGKSTLSAEKSDSEDEEALLMETLKGINQMVDEPVSDTFDLYFYTSRLPIIEDDEEFNKLEDDINKILLKLNDKNENRAFSLEAEELLEEMTTSAKLVIEKRKLYRENEKSENIEGLEELQESYLNEITDIADSLVVYEKLYHAYKTTK